MICFKSRLADLGAGMSVRQLRQPQIPIDKTLTSFRRQLTATSLAQILNQGPGEKLGLV